VSAGWDRTLKVWDADRIDAQLFMAAASPLLTGTPAKSGGVVIRG